MENTITILFEKGQINPNPFLLFQIRNTCSNISHAWQRAVGIKKLLFSNVFSIHIIINSLAVDRCLFVNQLSATTVKIFDLASLWTLEQMPLLRTDFTFSCLAELWGIQNTSAAFVHVVVLLQTVQIKQKTPPLLPNSQDTKGFAADVVYAYRAMFFWWRILICTSKNMHSIFL